MAEVKNATDPVQLAFIKKKPGFNADAAFIVVRGRKFAIPFNKKGKFTLTRKEAMHYVSKSRMWGQAHLDNSAVLAIVEMSDELSDELKDAAGNTLDGQNSQNTEKTDGGTKKPSDMNYNELIAYAQSLGMEVVSGGIKKAELLAEVEKKLAEEAK